MKTKNKGSQTGPAFFHHDFSFNSGAPLVRATAAAGMTGRNPYNHLAERKAAPKRFRLELTKNLLARLYWWSNFRLIRGTQTGYISQQHEPVSRRENGILSDCQ